MRSTTHRLVAFLSLVAAVSLTASCKPDNDNDAPVTPIPSTGCQPWDCGNLPDDAENALCADGVTMSGPTGDCIAHGSTCAWKVVSCPDPVECEPAACGAAATQPNYMCTDDRTIAGPTGRCLKKQGVCQWEIVKCPNGRDICAESACGAAPALPNWLCSDGSTVAGPTGVCAKASNGTCSWEITRCP